MTTTSRLGLAAGALAIGLLTQTTPALAQSSGRQRGQPRKEQVDQCKLETGDRAPDFHLSDPTDESKVKLSKLRGKPVFLVFGSYT